MEQLAGTDGDQDKQVHVRATRYKLRSLVICIAGFALCALAYYPGVFSPDSVNIYRAAQRFSFADWHGTIMSLLWALIYLATGRPEGMLFLLLALYWGALFLFAQSAARISPWGAIVMAAAGFLPYAINFAGTLWVDVLLATSWLMCAALVFSADIRHERPSLLRQGIAWLLFLVGGWTRANALFAAVPLGLYLVKPHGTLNTSKRVVLGIALLAGIWIGNWVLSYGILNALHQHPIHQITTYDLAGISHFSGKNYLPSTWSEGEEAAMLSSCYTPQAWNEYLNGQCAFVRKRLQEQGLWGSSELWRAWITAIRQEPLSYLRHRAGHFAYFITAREYVFDNGEMTQDGDYGLQRNSLFKLLRNYVFGASRIGPFRPIYWVVLSFAGLFAARSCTPPVRRLVTAMCLSSFVYLGTYFFVGVASNFRYAYWAVLATTVSVILIACDWTANRN